MAQVDLRKHTIGWIGAGRMGFAMAQRLLKAGCDVSIYNRTRSKAEPLEADGGTIVDSIADLADRDIVFTIVGGPDDFIEELRHVERVLAGRETSAAISLERGLETMLVLAAAHRSAREGRIVRIEYAKGCTLDALRTT